jgi:hypothetical protein
VARYARSQGFRIETGEESRNYFQFADGSYEETVGQVHTSWTFASGERIPITFEVLENCVSEVIIGEELIYEHNIFEKHSSSILVWESQLDAYDLAPFDFIKARTRSRVQIGQGEYQPAMTGAGTLNHPSQ